jgi:hypothetical protein
VLKTGRRGTRTTALPPPSVAPEIVMRYRSHLVLSLVLPWLFITPALCDAAPVITFEEEALVVAGASPNAAVAWIGVGRSHAGFTPQRLTLWQVVDADATGTARLELGRPVPAESAFVAVDLTAGEMVVAAPPGTPLREVDLPHQAVPAGLRTLEDRRSGLAVLWARPAADGTGTAWGGAVSDGSDLDGDGREDRGVEVQLDRLQPLGASPAPPETLAEGDVLVGVDLETLETYAVRFVR